MSVSNWLHHSTNCHSLSHVLQCLSGAGEGLSTDSRQLETWQHHSRPGQVGPYSFWHPSDINYEFLTCFLSVTFLPLLSPFYIFNSRPLSLHILQVCNLLFFILPLSSPTHMCISLWFLLPPYLPAPPPPPPALSPSEVVSSLVSRLPPRQASVSAAAFEKVLTVCSESLQLRLAYQTFSSMTLVHGLAPTHPGLQGLGRLLCAPALSAANRHWRQLRLAFAYRMLEGQLNTTTIWIIL